MKKCTRCEIEKRSLCFPHKDTKFKSSDVCVECHTAKKNEKNSSIPDGHRWCLLCDTHHPESEFYLRKDGKYRSYCKDSHKKKCRDEYWSKVEANRKELRPLVTRKDFGIKRVKGYYPSNTTQKLINRWRDVRKENAKCYDSIAV